MLEKLVKELSQKKIFKGYKLDIIPFDNDNEQYVIRAIQQSDKADHERCIRDIDSFLLEGNRMVDVEYHIRTKCTDSEQLELMLNTMKSAVQELIGAVIWGNHTIDEPRFEKCVNCGCSFKVNKDSAELCPVCQDEILSGKDKQLPVDCDICGEYFYPADGSRLCPSCYEEQCR